MLNFFKNAGVTLSLDCDRLSVEGLKALPTDQADRIRDHIRKNREALIGELVQQQHDELWEKAWALADEIDDVNGAPIEDRRSMMPELNRMRVELVRLEQAGAKTPTKGLNP